MEKEQRNRLQKATQDARKLLEEEFRSQLLQTYDIDVEKVRWAEEPGAHLQAEQRLIREKLVAWIEHKEAQIHDRKEALLLALREMAFTALNRFVALKLIEARELVRHCVSGGLESAGFLEFTAVAQGLLADQESSYRLYLETIFEDVSRELRALFNPRDPASLLWPKRAALLELLDILNRPELAELWIEDETLGWVYQYFNGDAERKKMREESAAPRNSRELAVRNQFFTPRYVVEFLTDNTLGRIWYEMRQGNTGLKDRCRYLVRRPNEVWLQPGEDAPAEVVADQALSQEDLLRQPAYMSHRALKDPREIRMLDPACGSMHFGLYAFDLYLEIYSEAWEIAKASAEQVRQSQSFALFVAYAANFSNKEAFLSEVPRLILQHNIHGVDIDLRATQIAQLTLWLRAQRAWQDQQLQIADRAPITRSNVVCAEPMPGERELLADFVDQQFPEPERGLVQRLLEAVFDKMQLAGEIGSLLKIEEEIRDAIHEARREWQKLAIQQRDLFSAAELAALDQAGTSLTTDTQNLADDFWIDIEERIYAALRDYAEQSESGDVQRKLFAEDAARGFAFINICRHKYDATLMNPPFGNASDNSEDYCTSAYLTWSGNLAAAFIDRLSQLTSFSGRMGCICDHSIAIRSTYEKVRRECLVDSKRLDLWVKLGWDVLDASVETFCAVCQIPGQARPGITGVDLFNVQPTEKGQALLKSLSNTTPGPRQPRRMKHAAISRLPNCVVDLTWPPFLIRIFSQYDSLRQQECEALVGHQLEAERYYQLHWELDFSSKPIESKEWTFAFKGGDYSPGYLPEYFVAHTGSRLERVPKSSANVLRNTSAHHRAGVGYGKRGEFVDAQPLRPSSIFTHEGFAFPLGSASDRWIILTLLNSHLFSYGINKYCGQHKTNGYVNIFAFPPREKWKTELIEAKCRDLVWIKAKWMTKEEYDYLFAVPAIFLLEDFEKRTLRGSADALLRLEASDLSTLNELYRDLNQAVYDAYGVSLEEAKDCELYCESRPALWLTRDSIDASMNVKQYSVADQLVSWSLGVVFGRWDIRYANGAMIAPGLPDPFSPLPHCPLGLLQGMEGMPATPVDLPKTYPVQIAWDGILVTDLNSPMNIDQRVREALGIIWRDENEINANAIAEQASEILGASSLSIYFQRPTGFFADHLKRYSKGGRQSPIYWHLSAGNCSYSAWLYCHRFTQDTLYRVLRDFVEPRIQQAERESFELESQGALSGDAAMRLQETQTLLQDLRIFKNELNLVAPLWNPNLNDGVIINHAILWRVTPYTPWQKKCKECWDKLVKGDYDWVHLALHLWPERVIPKCTTDRSLAIAHSLEERLWQETKNGNWLPRQLSEADLQTLIAEHSNPAVKSALERFLAAPPPVAPTRTRASRSTRASGSSTPRRGRGSAAVVDAEATRQLVHVLTVAPEEGLSKNAIAAALEVEPGSLTAVIKQLKERGQIEQLGAAKGTKYCLTEQGRAAVASQAGEND